MPVTERAEDAHWKVIQKNTFTRWTNEHLKQVNKFVSDLEYDLSDGLHLIALVEVLSGRRILRYNKRPIHRTQKLENVSLCLDFLQEDEKIKLVNIDSSDIVDCNLKLILGLIWTLILHYSISMLSWDGEENAGMEDQTPKQKLLAWINSKIPEKSIRNFTTDWNDGTAIGALVDAIAPGLCPDWQILNPRNHVANATEAMGSAEQWLDVPQLIEPNDLCNPMVDELSMMTYLSQFPSAKLKPGAPLRPRINPSRVRAYGPGIEPIGNSVGAVARFTIETFNAGRGQVDVQILNPRGIPEECQIVFNNDKVLSHHCSYLPSMPGQYQVGIKFAGTEIPKSPFFVKVDAASGDPSKVKVRGPGIEKSGVVVNHKTNFEVSTKNAGNGIVEVFILDPTGHKDTVRPAVNKKSEEIWNVEYVPTVEGLHKISVLFAGKPISNSPFSVVTSPAVDGRKCYVTGRGIQPKGVRVGDSPNFVVHTENSGGDADMNARVVGPGGVEERVSVKNVDPQTYECSYVPKRPGQYVVSVVYGGQQVARSPFRVEVGPKKDTRIRAFGPGLSHGIVGFPASFTVETNEETGALGFAIEGPSQAKIDCKDNGDGSADISYWPTTPGEYAVHILCNEEDIPKSPYMAEISQTTNAFDPTKVEASGPGLMKMGVTVNKWAEFMVDAHRAGPAQLNCIAMEVDYTPVEVIVKDNKDGTYFCRYMPKRAVKHTIQIVYGSVSIPQSPFRVFVQEESNPARVKVFGPAIDRPVKTNQSTYLIVDCSDAGPGDVAIALSNERGLDVPVETLDNSDSTFRIQFEPTTAGTYSACIIFAEEEIPNSPFKIQVEPGIDVGQITVGGLVDRTYVESLNDFTVDARAIAPRGQGKVKSILTSPSGSRSEAAVTNNNDGTYTGLYSPTETGQHKLDVSYEGVSIPRSPFNINVLPGNDINRVKAFGPGLKGGSTNQPQKFTVETKGAGRGGLGISIDGPSEAKINCSDNGNGTCSVEYLPNKSGIYDIAVRFAEKHIPGSPFKAEIVDEVNPQKVKCYGPGVDLKGIRKGQPGNFTIDASQAGPATPEVSATDQRGRKRPGLVKPRGDGTYDATYQLDVEGPCKVDVTYAGRPVPGSPFTSRILPAYDANKVRVSGEGVNPVGVTASLPANFLIDTRDAGLADQDVIIFDPSGDLVRPTILDKGDRTFGVTYTPCDAGRFTINIKYGGDPVPFSPFYVNAKSTGDASQVRVLGGVNSVVPVGEKQIIKLDTSQAGVGNVTCNVSAPNDVDVDTNIVKSDDGTVAVVYTPRLPGVYVVNLKFGGHPIPEGRFSQQAVDPIQFAPIEKMKESPAGKYSSVDFRIPVGPIFNFVSAEVTTPSMKKHSPKLDDNHDGTVKIAYHPTELGLHRLDVWYNKVPVQGSPFHFYVHSLHSGQIVAFGPGLSHGIVREPCNFTIVTKDAGAGGLSLAVEGPSKAEINCADNKDGTCSVSYVPTTPGEYSIIIRFDEKHIIGSPYTAKIMSPAGEEENTAKVIIGSNSDISLKVTDADISDLTASIRNPSGLEEPCSLKRLPNGTIGISFMPREVGDYLVSVYRNGRHIPNSPFRISVSETQIGNARLVRAYGKGLTSGSANEISEFYVDTKNAGYGGLSISIEGPSKADIDCEDRDDNTCRVTYRPTESGSYIVNIKFAEEHIPGSPYLVKIDGEPSGKVTERIVRQKDAADVTHIGSDCELSLKIPGASRYDLEASVVSPSGVKEPCNVQDRGDSNYTVKFIPRETGPHLVNITHRGSHVTGSPFTFTVGQIKDGGGAYKVRALGPGLERGEVLVPCPFNIYTREAGAGSLSVAIEGPAKAEIDFQDRKDGSCEVAFVCSEPGNYLVSVKFNNDHIPGSPFNVFVAPSAADVRNMNVHDLQRQKLEVNKPAAYAVDLNGIKGKLDARVIAPSGTEDEAVVQEMDKNRCAVRFIPRENGLHLLHVRCNGNHVNGSPFHIQVGQEVANTSLVQASGDGLSKGQTGQLCRFLVNTSRAGPGALAVTIDGPSKVQLSCYEAQDGFDFMYTPTEPGEYLVNIRYAGNTHIPGSPFKVHIEGPEQTLGWSEQSDIVVESVTKTSTTQKVAASKRLHDSDASKITASGAGLQRATVNKEATFTVDTGRAGYNVLMVGVLGPNIPCEEVYVKHIGQRQYSIGYIVHERGDYLLIVKWGDQHVPGSPFQISVQ